MCCIFAQKHAQCSETFYKDCFLEALKEKSTRFVQTDRQMDGWMDRQVSFLVLLYTVFLIFRGLLSIRYFIPIYFSTNTGYVI